jgi:uncharacterized OB-fold protein
VARRSVSAERVDLPFALVNEFRRFEVQAPYTVALVKLEEGPLVTAQITDAGTDPLAIGTPVEMVTRKLRTEGERGIIVYGYKFRPVLPQAA